MMDEEKIKLLKKMREDMFRIQVEILNDGKLPYKANYTDARM